MLRKVRLYGQLAEFVGRKVIEADLSSVAEAVRMLIANFPELDRHMADQAAGHIGVVEEKTSAHLKASWVEALWCDQHLQLITTKHGPREIGLAMHHGQGDCWCILLISAAWKHTAGLNAIALQAVFPGLMAPAQSLMEMHHACCVGVSKAHHSLQA